MRARPEPGLVLVTGGTGAIGREIVETLAGHGYDVAFTWHSAKDDAAELERAHVERVFGYQSDFEDEAEIRATLARVVECHGAPLRVVNNAGIADPAVLPAIGTERWNRLLNVNLTSAFIVVRQLIRPMLQARFGRIVNVGSVAATSGGAGHAHYATAKAGLIGLTRSIAREYGPRNVTANVISPGLISSPMIEGSLAGLSLAASAIPVGRLGTPAEVAFVARMLLDDAASYITGAVVPVDGGLGMGA